MKQCVPTKLRNGTQLFLRRKALVKDWSTAIFVTSKQRLPETSSVTKLTNVASYPECHSTPNNATAVFHYHGSAVRLFCRKAVAINPTAHASQFDVSQCSIHQCKYHEQWILGSMADFRSRMETAITSKTGLWMKERV
jgi:hypothetical protein